MDKTPEESMWHVVRKRSPKVTVAEVEQLARVDAHMATLFLIGLEDAGYVVRRGECFALARDTGPEPPEFFHVHALEDGNTGEIHPCGEESKAGVGRILGGLELIVSNDLQIPPGPLRPGAFRATACNVLDPVIVFLDGTLTFSLEDAVQDTGLDRKQVLRVLDKLVKEGRLELVEDARATSKKYREFGPAKRNPKYRVVKGAPARRNRQPKRETMRDKMWREIRKLRRFTRKNLQEASSAGEETVREYTVLLERHGYLKVVEQRGKAFVYLLAEDPGVERPETPEIPRRKPC